MGHYIEGSQATKKHKNSEDQFRASSALPAWGLQMNGNAGDQNGQLGS